MNRRRLTSQEMIRARKLAMFTFAAATILLFGDGRSHAQSDTPDPSMLLNLDLFRKPETRGTSWQGSDGDADSMVEQIRALRAMGYLNGKPDLTLPPDDNRPIARFGGDNDPEEQQ